MLSRELLFVRACASFAANLALILSVAMLAGALLLIRDADLLLERFRQPAPVLESLRVAEVKPGERQDAPAAPEPAPSDSARHS
jgi:hypothetical protein